MNELPPDSKRNGPLSLRDRVQSLRMPSQLPPARRTPLSFVPWILCLLFAVNGVVLAMRMPSSQATEDDKSALKSAGTAPETALGIGEVMLESKGYIVPIRTIQVSPKVGGVVVSLRFEEGMIVQKGYVLAILEMVDYQSERDRAKGQVDGARHRWHELSLSYWPTIFQAEADLENALASRNQEMEQSMYDRKAPGTVASSDLAKRDATIRVLNAKVKWFQEQIGRLKGQTRRSKGELERKVQNAKAELDQYEADLVKAEWRLANCTIAAPVTGIILAKRAEEGNMVNPSAFSNGLSASLCDMADLTELEVDMSIPERDVGRLIEFKKNHRHPQKCQVRADAFPGRIYDGFVSRIMPQGDRAKGAVPVRVKIVIPASEAGIYLRPEMSAAVTFLNEEYVVGRRRWYNSGR